MDRHEREALSVGRYEALKVLFPGAYFVMEAVERSSCLVVFRDRDLSFDDFKSIADAFDTRSVNVGAESRDDGGCPTCSSPYAVAVVRIEKIGREP